MTNKGQESINSKSNKTYVDMTKEGLDSDSFLIQPNKFKYY